MLLILAAIVGIAVRGSVDLLSQALAGSIVLASLLLCVSNLFPTKPALEPTPDSRVDGRS